MFSQSLSEQVAKNHLAHALLFHGPDRDALKSAGLGLTQAILCENKKNGSACGNCRHCFQVEKGMHADLMNIAAQADSQGIKIEQIRQVIARANLRPLLADSKVFIIEGAESMNEAAQNALLKTLEEPPPGTFFILMSSHPEGVLATVRSRCQMITCGVDGGAIPSASPRGEHELPLPDPLAEPKRASIEFMENPSDVSQAPDLTKLERNEITQVLDYLIEHLSQKLLDEDEVMEKIELLAEFKEKITQNVHVKLALAVLWNELGRGNS